MSTFFDISNYIWPLLILFQVAISFIALRKLGGAGPWLMVIGAVIIALRSFYTIIADWLGVGLDYSSGIPAGHYLIYSITTIGRLLFLVGVLLTVQMALKPKAEPLGRTSF